MEAGGLIASPAHRKLAAVPSWLRCRAGCSVELVHRA